MTQVKQQKPSKDDLLIAMRKALNIERRSRYADFHGRHSTFSQFMRRTTAGLSRKFPLDATWVTLRGLFRQYPNIDVATRISIIRRAEELLEPHLELLFRNSAESRTTSEPESASGSASRNASGSASLIAGPSINGPSINISIANGGANAKSTEGEIDDAEISDEEVDKLLSTSEESDDLPGDAYTNQSENTERDNNLMNRRSVPEDSHKTQPARPQEQPTRHTDRELPAAPGAGHPGALGSVKGPLQQSAVNGPLPQSGANGSLPQSGVKGPLPQGAVKPPTSSKPDAARHPNAKDPEEVPVQFVKGVGPKMAEMLSRIGVNTVADLLRHYPRRHLDFQNRLLIRDLKEGQEVSIFGFIRSVSAFQSRNRNVSVLTIVISDSTGSVTITRFVGGKSNKYLLDRYKNQYPKGAQVLASGIVERDSYTNKFSLKNAEVEILGLVSDGEEGDTGSLHAGRLVPVYPLTDGLSLRYLRTIIHNALESYGNGLVDHLPGVFRSELELMELTEALRAIHFPESVESKDHARRRLVFDELFAIQLQLAHRRYKFDCTESALALKYSEEGLVRELIDNLPFKLTGAQERVFAEITRDLGSPKPMHRLIQGDVGSGKTVVALLSCLVAIENGFQAAVMAPTEILAEQHYRQFQKLVTSLGLRCALVLGKQGVKERREIRQQLLGGQIHIAIGTHALLEDDVEFHKLGLIIIDEQHRFGVKQRARLKAKSQSPELLTMTATPIPRTLAMTMHGDLDVSEIDELPPGRKPVITKIARPGQKTELWNFIEKEVAKGRQVYVVFPLIEESESLSAKAATKEFENLQKKYEGKQISTADGATVTLKFGLMHGKLKPQEKDEVMDQFRKEEFNVLVSTTVIEVGVDVPNASVMVIENADRFGLAQLHQLRGRVGRGAEQSYCFLVSDMKSATVRERLEIMTQTNDGFVVAEKDLEIRGPGEFLGFRQSGLPDLILADLVKDARILEEARNTAIGIIKNDPELDKMPELRKLLNRKAGGAEVEIMRSG